MSSFDRSLHRLAGSGNESGGLFIKKKQDSAGKKSDDTFKRPSGSILGLDILARRKRAEREAAEEVGEKRPRLERTKLRDFSDSYDDSGVRISFGRSDSSKERKYRSSLLETPSHPGGVSDEALEKMHSRRKRDQGQGLFASSIAGRERETDRTLVGRGRERDRTLVGRGEEGGRDEGKGGGGEGGDSSRRMRERAWEQETPRLDRGRGNTTPYPRTRGTRYMCLTCYPKVMGSFPSSQMLGVYRYTGIHNIPNTAPQKYNS